MWAPPISVSVDLIRSIVERARCKDIFFILKKTVVAMGLLVTTMQISCNECLTLAHPVRTRNEQEPKSLAQNWANRMVRFH
jgi:hypothetical protein